MAMKTVKHSFVIVGHLHWHWLELPGMHSVRVKSEVTCL